MKSFLASAAFGFLLLAVPAPAFAASATFFGPIISPECHCNEQISPGGTETITTAPDFGCVLQTIQNVINLAISLSIILFTLYLAYAGFRLMTSGGSSEARSEGKTRLLNVMVGLAVLLCSWIIVDFVMKTLYNEGTEFGPWNAILAGKANTSDRCIVAKEPSSITTGVVDIVTSVTPGTSGGGSGTGSTGGGCVDPGSVIAFPSAATDGGARKGTQDTVQRFLNMRTAALKDGITLKAGSAYRPDSEQLSIWNSHKCSRASGKTVCTAGSVAALPCSLGGTGSNHTKGTAIDIQTNAGGTAWLRSHAAQYGFYNKIATEPWHWSDTGN